MAISLERIGPGNRIAGHAGMTELKTHLEYHENKERVSLRSTTRRGGQDELKIWY